MVTPASGCGPERGRTGNAPGGAGGGSSGLISAGPAVSAVSSAPQSASERAIGPAWSRVGASGMTPPSGMRPCVGLTVHTPLSAAGMRSDPHVSLPIAAGTRPAASAAADPPLDPPGARSSAHGLPTWSVVPPAANSWVCVWPTSTMPGAASRCHATASSVATCPASTRLDAVSGSPATAYRSFSPSGIPHSSGVSSPSRDRRWSAARACAPASSG